MPHGHHPAPGGATQEPGALIHWPRRYDLLITVLFAGRGPRVRTNIADAVGLYPVSRSAGSTWCVAANRPDMWASRVRPLDVTEDPRNRHGPVSKGLADLADSSGGTP